MKAQLGERFSFFVNYTLADEAIRNLRLAILILN
jgi:hypothetical protein